MSDKVLDKIKRSTDVLYVRNIGEQGREITNIEEKIEYYYNAKDVMNTDDDGDSTQKLLG